MMLRALAEAARVLERDDFSRPPISNAEFLLRDDAPAGRRLYRTWKPGHAAHLNGYLEDHANVADGLVALYEATFDAALADGGDELADVILARFCGRRQRRLLRHLRRPRDADHAAEGHLRQRHAVGQRRGRRRAAAPGAADRQRRTTSAPPRRARTVARADGALSARLRAVAERAGFLARATKEVAIVGALGAPDTEALLRVVFEPFRPNKVVAGGDRGSLDQPLLEGRDAARRPATAYVCEHYVCQAPTTDPHELSAQLSVPT